MIRALALAMLALIAGCQPRPRPVERVIYRVGAPYQAQGVWYYPAEDFGYDRTGLADIKGADHAGLTADGEVFDQTVLAASHQTLQLPAIARVTNLDNGRQVVLRINDRGPASPGRLLSLTRRAAALLAVAATAVPVRVQVLQAESRALAEALNGGPRLDIAAAPRGAVQEVALAPPSGVAASAGGQVARPAIAPPSPGAAVPPERLPEIVTEVPVAGWALWIEADTFSRAAFAERQRARLAALGATVEHRHVGRQDSYRVRMGPFPSVAQADAALDQAIQAGVTDARITVE